ncbi:MAG: hypothetical protein IT426_06740 [Pirellulales bacterium]|nr:hypothetical protein [Pirellulales bacterium]
MRLISDGCIFFRNPRPADRRQLLSGDSPTSGRTFAGLLAGGFAQGFGRRTDSTLAVGRQREFVVAARDPAGRGMYWDARYALGSPGRLVAAFCTYDRERRRNRNIHLSQSRDGGRTWSIPRDSGLTGQVAHPLMLGDDRLLLVYVDRFRAPDIRASLSADGGRSFGGDVPIYDHSAHRSEAGESSTPADYLQDMELWTFGRVEAVAGEEGTVWITYYAGNTPATSIRWARLEIWQASRPGRGLVHFSA